MTKNEPCDNKYPAGTRVTIYPGSDSEKFGTIIRYGEHADNLVLVGYDEGGTLVQLCISPLEIQITEPASVEDLQAENKRLRSLVKALQETLKRQQESLNALQSAYRSQSLQLAELENRNL